MSHVIKGLLVVMAVSAVLGAVWLRYSDFLHRGSKPPTSAVKLDELETKGLEDRSFTDINGTVFSVFDLKGKILIINFWASWCDPCVEEFPSMLKLVERFKGDVVLLAISGDKNKKEIFEFLEIFKVETSDSFRVVWDKEMSVADAFGTSVLPESYIFDSKMRLVRKVAGVDNWFTPQAISFFEELVTQSKR